MPTLSYRCLLTGLVPMLGLMIAGSSLAQPTRLPLPPPQMNSAAPRLERPRSEPLATGQEAPVIRTLAEREARLGATIEQLRADGSIAQDQASKARARLSDIRRTEDWLRRRHHGALTDRETFRLEGRIRSLAASLRRAG